MIKLSLAKDKEINISELMNNNSQLVCICVSNYDEYASEFFLKAKTETIAKSINGIMYFTGDYIVNKSLLLAGETNSKYLPEELIKHTLCVRRFKSLKLASNKDVDVDLYCMPQKIINNY